jgi:serine/threonine-protein kinase
MKLVEGRTLAILLSERPTPAHDLPCWLKVFEQVCQTIAYAHSRGVVHRDLKPSNIMVGSFGEVQVMDWGIAKVVQRDQRNASTVIETIRTDSDVAASLAGSVAGTPGYMAPEQANGLLGSVGPPCDVFGLGSILCEILTDYPAYKGDDSSVIFKKAQRGDLGEAFQRLDACDADAELVRLAKVCLAPDLATRPADAGIVAAAVTKYLAGVQERLRAAELERAEAEARAEAEGQARREAQARACAEHRARRLTMGLAALVLFGAIGIGAGYAWYVEGQARTRRQVESDLAQAQQLQHKQQWAEAREAVGRAQGRLAGKGPAALQARIDRALADLEQVRANQTMTATLDNIRLRQADVVKDDHFDAESADNDYRLAFRQYGLDVEKLPAEEAIQRIQQSAICDVLIAALDDWALLHLPNCQTNRSLLMNLANSADTDPWRQQFRTAWSAGNLKVVRKMASQVASTSQPPTTYVLLSMALGRSEDNDRALAVLEQGQERFPGDFWLNQRLARRLQLTQPTRCADAVGYYRAALALRPNSPGVLVNFAIALLQLGRSAQAAAANRKAIELAPTYAMAHSNLGMCLRTQGLIADAEKAFREALRHQPGLVHALYGLGNVLAEQGKMGEAEKYYQEALKGKVNVPDAPAKRGQALLKTGQFDEAEARFREAAELKQQKAEFLCNLGTVLLQQGKVKEAEKRFRESLHMNRNLAEAHTNLGSCLQHQGQPDAAAACFREAIRCNPKMFPAQANLGCYLLQQGQLDEAEQELRAAIGLDPRQACLHSMLGMTLINQGRNEEAEAPSREAVRLDRNQAEYHANLGHLLSHLGLYADALTELRRSHELGAKSPGWSHPSADWVKDGLRRVALEARLPDALAGRFDVASGSEWSDLARACRARKLHAAAVRCYTRAFEKTPALLVDLQHGNRVLALRSAALAGCGRGDGAPKNPAAQATLRRQALTWLGQERARWEESLRKGAPGQRAAAHRALQQLLRERDLAELRDREALARLPAAERADWQRVWTEVEALVPRAVQRK